MRILVSGSRDWTDRAVIYKAFKALPASDEVNILIHGDCRGADKLAASVANELGWEVVAVVADWSQGPRAGPMRNSAMLAMRPDLVIYFHEDLERSKGTRDLVKKARKKFHQEKVIDGLVLGS